MSSKIDNQKPSSQLTTLCYIEQDGKYLMMHRVKKKNDINKDKWIGVGGHFEYGETPEECLLREVKEETGLTLLNYRMRGNVTGDTTHHICNTPRRLSTTIFCGRVKNSRV